MLNQEIARIFYQIADMYEIKGENPFRVRAYRRAAQNVENLAEDIEKVIQSNRKIPGIGQDLRQKIEEILKTGTCQTFEKLKKEIPSSLLEILAIPGVGPRTAKLIYEHFKITSLEELEKLCKEHKVQCLPGLRAKTEENILKGIQLLKKGRERRPLGLILPFAEEIVKILKKRCHIERIDLAGSVRRRKETVKDIDILVCSKNPWQVMEEFVNLPFVAEIIAQGMTKSSIRTQDGLQIDLRVVERECYGAALCYFTGSKAHNIRIRELAVRKGLKINEYGIFKDDKRIGGKEEEEVFKAVDLPYIPPELREDWGEIEAAIEGKLPQLVEMNDIKGDFHVHSKYSDGTATLAEIAKKAKALGLQWVAICDHSQSLKVAKGVSIEDLRKKRKEIDVFNKKNPDVKLLCGTEVDILNDGSLDYPNEILKEMDFVIAAIHTGFKQDKKTLTRRIIKAMENPYVHSIAHPTGRLIGERDPYPLDMERVFRTAATTGTYLEINAYYKRLDLNDTFCRAAKSQGIVITIGTDAHMLDQMGFLRLGVFVARRGWLEKKDVLNTLSYEELMQVLRKVL